MGRRSLTGSGCVALSGSNPTTTVPSVHPNEVVHAGASDRPLIGVTTYLEQAQTGVWDVRAAFLPQVYLNGITDGGGIAIALPPQPSSPEVARAVLAGLDGLVIAGGADVNPARYGQERRDVTDQPRLDRDQWEDDLLNAAIEMELPFLAICRGAQLLNVSLGGTLHQHLPDVINDESYRPGAGVFGAKNVTVESGTKLAELIGEAGHGVPVYHHQAIDAIAPALNVTARTEQGVIQAVELPTVPFGVGVQWHPEQSPDDRRLFAGLVEAAREYRQKRENA